MAGPLDLRGRVIITDGGALGTLGAVQSRLGAIASMQQRANNAIVSGARNVRSGIMAMGTSALGVYGAMRVLRQAEEFNRSVFGVGAAAVSDYTTAIDDAATGTRKVVVDLESVRGVMRSVERDVLSLSGELGQTPSRLGGIAEVLAKAGFNSDKLVAATRAVGQVAVTDLETPVAKLGEFASVLDTIYQPRKGEAWAQFFKRQMDIIRIAAGETRLSVGSTMEGMRAHSALYSRLGMSEEDNALMLMAAVKEGAEASETSHTLKSNAVRFMKMTAEGQAVFSAAGLRRSDYSDSSQLDPMRATGNLARLFPEANIKGAYRSGLTATIKKAQESGQIDDSDFIERLSRDVAKRAGVNLSDELSKERFEEKFMNAIVGAGQKALMLKLYRDMIRKNMTPAQWATIFEGRRIGTNMQLRGGLEKYGMDADSEYVRKLGMASGAGLDATQSVYDESSYGKLQRFNAQLEKFQITLSQSAGFEKFLSGITRMFEVLGQLPQPVLDVATSAGALAIALGPIAVGFAAIGKVLGPLKWLAGIAGGALGLRGAGAGMAGLFAAGGAGAASTKAGRALAAGMSAAGAAALNKSVGDRMIAGMSGAAGAGAAAKGGGFLSRFWGMKALGAAGKVGLRFVPGVGLVLMAGAAAIGGMTALSKGASAGEVLKETALGAVGLDGLSDSGALPAAVSSPGAPGIGGASAAGEIEQVRAEAERGAAVMRESMSALAAAIQTSVASVAAAAQSAAANVRNAAAAAGSVPLNTGPSMRGAN